MRAGEEWGRLYDQRWCRVTIPAGGGRWLHWDEQGEATLFVDGVPFYGFDVAHFKAYNASASEPDGWQSYRQRYIDCGEEQYLERVGGLAAIGLAVLARRRWPWSSRRLCSTS